MPILDTNVLLRYLTGDDAEQGPRALALLEDIEAGRKSATLTEAVLVETVQVLSSHESYAFDPASIRTRLTAILRLPDIQIPQKALYYEALDLYAEYSRLSFVDALCVAQALHSPDKTVISFDRDFRNLPGLNWEQP